MNCTRCGHDPNAHADRAFIPCITCSSAPGRCWCDGYTADRGAVKIKEHRTAWTRPAA